MIVKKKTFLKWAGNKQRCVELILNHLPPAKRLVEPFAGSGAIFLNSNYDDYLLADSNADLINLFKFVQQKDEEFINYCAQFFTAETNQPTYYYHARETFNLTTDKQYKAALFLYLNKHCYNGLCRYNCKGYYNVPFGCHNNPYFPRKEMQYFSKKSKIAKFVNNDFRQVFEQAREGDVIYCDPPYVPLSLSANFTSYTNKKFTLDDQIDLATLAKESTDKGITVVISNHDTKFTRKHYKYSQIISFPVMRLINCMAKKRGKVLELVAVFKPR